MEFAQLNYRLGTLLMDMHNLERAYEYFQGSLKAVFLWDAKDVEAERDEYASKVHFKFGIVCLKLGKKEKARVNFEYCL
jgi:hypothetical protein